MTHITCRLTAKNRDQLRNPTLGNRVWAIFTFLQARINVVNCLVHFLRSQQCGGQAHKVHEATTVHVRLPVPLYNSFCVFCVIFYVLLFLFEPFLVHCSRLMSKKPDLLTNFTSVCVYVCLSLCPSAIISPELPVQSPPIFNACYLWPWLGPPLAALRYVMYFRFYG